MACYQVTLDIALRWSAVIGRIAIYRHCAGFSIALTIHSFDPLERKTSVTRGMNYSDRNNGTLLKNATSNSVVYSNCLVHQSGFANPDRAVVGSSAKWAMDFRSTQPTRCGVFELWRAEDFLWDRMGLLSRSLKISIGVLSPSLFSQLIVRYSLT